MVDGRVGVVPIGGDAVMEAAAHLGARLYDLAAVRAEGVILDGEGVHDGLRRLEGVAQIVVKAVLVA